MLLLTLSRLRWNLSRLGWLLRSALRVQTRREKSEGDDSKQAAGS